MDVPCNQDISFDAETTHAMGEAFDLACKSLGDFGMVTRVREIVAKRIVEAAKYGERDATQLYDQALKALGIDQTSNLLAA